MDQVRRFNGLPSMVWPYCQVLASGKPLLAAVLPAFHIEVHSIQVRIDAVHLRRYREVCGLANTGNVPHAYLHVLAMPLHMRVFTDARFPVKVLGLVHLRNVIRQYQAISADAVLDLGVSCQSLRETGSGQEYDLITRCEVQGELVWQEVSTMLARRATPGKRPTIERAVRDAERVQREQTLTATADTGRRYALVSGDFNPIHLFDRTAQAFQFKQKVAHGMWSLARCIGMAEAALTPAVELDAEFKLPVYLPSEFNFRQQRTGPGTGVKITAEPE